MYPVLEVDQLSDNDNYISNLWISHEEQLWDMKYLQVWRLCSPSEVSRLKQSAIMKRCSASWSASYLWWNFIVSFQCVKPSIDNISKRVKRLLDSESIYITLRSDFTAYKRPHVSPFIWPHQCVFCSYIKPISKHFNSSVANALWWKMGAVSGRPLTRAQPRHSVPSPWFWARSPTKNVKAMPLKLVCGFNYPECNVSELPHVCRVFRCDLWDLRALLQQAWAALGGCRGSGTRCKARAIQLCKNIAWLSKFVFSILAHGCACGICSGKCLIISK